MKILYSCGFNLKSGEGKSRATAQKLDALKGITDHLYTTSLPFESNILKILFLPILEFYTCLLIILKRPNTYISRGFVGWLSQPLAKKIGTTTVREVHADLLGELDLIPYNGIALNIIYIISKISVAVDKHADIRIFNHPYLMEWHHKKHGERAFDNYTYNGYCKESISELNRKEARDFFGFDDNSKILVFTGAASEWHGVGYLADLQKEFNKNGDNIIIVCGGGRIRQDLDPDKILKNLSPLSDVDCAKLIKSADLCLLPVKNNRVSPGSPLKLYDYILNGAWIAAQTETPGYSDEVMHYNVGFCVDFENPAKARKEICNFLNSHKSKTPPPLVDVSWDIRMHEWMSIIKKLDTAKNKYML